MAGSAWRAASCARWTRRAEKKAPLPTNSPSGRSCAKVAKVSSISRLLLTLRTLDLQPHHAGSWFQLSQRRLSNPDLGRIDEHGHPSGSGHQLAEELQPLRRQLSREKIDTGRVAAWPCKAADKTQLDRIVAHIEDDGDGRGCRLGPQRRRGAERGDHLNPSANQVARQLRQPVELVLGPAVFDRHVLALNVAGLLEAPTKSAQRLGEHVGRLAVEEADHRHCCLLSARREWPRDRRSAE